MALLLSANVMSSPVDTARSVPPVRITSRQNLGQRIGNTGINPSHRVNDCCARACAVQIDDRRLARGNRDVRARALRDRNRLRTRGCVLDEHDPRYRIRRNRTSPRRSQTTRRRDLKVHCPSRVRRTICNGSCCICI